MVLCVPLHNGTSWVFAKGQLQFRIFLEELHTIIGTLVFYETL